MFNIKDLKDICDVISNDTGIPSNIIEKDFWVTTILDWIFNKSRFGSYFVFKGGTSLSKCYNIIKRFSEDVDLTIDYKILGIKEKQLSWVKNPSQSKKLQKLLSEKENIFFSKEFIPELKKYLYKLTKQDPKIEFESSRGICKIKYYFSHSFKSLNLLSHILIEVNGLGTFKETEKKTITSIIYQKFPHLFSNKEIPVLCTTWIKTFWDKITILHNKSHTEDLSLRSARHYFDIYSILSSDERLSKLIKRTDVLFESTKFKIKYYYSSKARYEDIMDGELNLKPKKDLNDKLIKDYEFMSEMIYGIKPAWETILLKIIKFQDVVNTLIKKQKELT